MMAPIEIGVPDAEDDPEAPVDAADALEPAVVDVEVDGAFDPLPHAVRPTAAALQIAAMMNGATVRLTTRSENRLTISSP